MRLIVVASLLALAACARDPEVPTIDSSRFAALSDEQRVHVQQVVDVCPGLRKYPDDWAVESVSKRDAYTEVKLRMLSPRKEMPSEYLASGHTCHFHVGRRADGSVAVAKRPCASACLDQKVDKLPGQSFFMDIR